MSAILDRHEIAATLETSPGVFIDLDVVKSQRGFLRIDRTLAPAVEAKLYVKSPADPFAWDPRSFYRRVRIEVLQRFGDVANISRDLTDQFGGGTAADITAAWAGLTAGDITDLPGRYYSTTTQTPTARTFDLVLRRVNHRLDGITELTLRSDEILLMDRLYTRTGAAGPGGGEGGSADDLVITYPTNQPVYSFAEWFYNIVAVWAGIGTVENWQFYQATGSTYIPITSQGGNEALSPAKTSELNSNPRIAMATNGWDLVRDFAGSLGLRVFSTGGRGLVVDAISAGTGRTVTLDHQQNLLDFELSIDLDAEGYAAKVAARYPAATPGDPDEFYVYIAEQAGPGRVIDRAGTAVVELTGFRGGGQYSVLTGSTAQLRAIQAPVTAVNRYDTLPGDDLVIVAPDVTLYGEVDAVEFELGATWQMTITATNLRETP